MNDNRQKSATEQVGALVATSGQNSTATEELAKILHRRFAKEEQEETQRKIEQDEYRKQQLESVERGMAAKNEGQASCDHLKPNRTTALNGQRDHQGDFHGVCSYCGKEFDEETLSKPRWAYLRIPSDRVGGPIR